MSRRKTAIKSCLNFVTDFMRSRLSATGNSLASPFTVSLDACWKFSLIILTTQTITSFLKWMLLLLPICKILCEHLCESQRTAGQITGGRTQSPAFSPCLQRVCAAFGWCWYLLMPVGLISLVTTSRVLPFLKKIYIYIFFQNQMYSFAPAAGFIKKMLPELCGILWVITRNTAVGGLAPSKRLLWVFPG